MNHFVYHFLNSLEDVIDVGVGGNCLLVSAFLYFIVGGHSNQNVHKVWKRLKAKIDCH